MSNLLSKKEQEMWDAELKNPTGHVLLQCEEHGYRPGSKISLAPAVMGCRECAAADIWYQVATAPPHKRLELFEKMEEAIHHMIEQGDQGFVAFEHPVIEYERDVN